MASKWHFDAQREKNTLFILIPACWSLRSRSHVYINVYTYFLLLRVCPILERCSLNKYSVYKKCELLVSFAAKGLKKSVYLAKNSMGILQDVGRVEKGHSQGVIGVWWFFFPLPRVKARTGSLLLVLEGWGVNGIICQYSLSISNEDDFHMFAEHQFMKTSLLDNY